MKLSKYNERIAPVGELAGVGSSILRGGIGVADDHISCGLNGTIQRKKVRGDGWTRARRKRFLDALAATCNVRMASEAAGLPPLSKSAYYLRKSDPEFAALWAQALEQGYETLELAVLKGALQAVNAIEIEGTLSDDPAVRAAARSIEPPPDRAANPTTLAALSFALTLLTKHATNAEARGRTTRGAPYPTAAETDAMILKLLGRVRDRSRAVADTDAAAAGARDQPGGDP